MTESRLSQQLAALLLAAQLAVTPAAAQAPITERLPEIGDVSGNLMTPAEEQRLGKAFMRGIRDGEKVIDDPLLVDYLQDLGRRLVANSDAAGQDYTFFLIDNPQINAFAGPAGYIGVFTGLVLTAETESELAAVLAHEIAHVTQAHLRRTWQAASQLSVPQAAVLLAAVVLGAAVGGDAAIAAATAGQAGLIQQQLNFSRANEQEADRVGISILAEADYEPRAMPSFFQRMGRANQSQASGIPEYLRTHPVTNSRIADSLGRAETYPFKQRVDDLRFHLLRAALRERQISSPQEAVLQFQRSLEDGRYRQESAERFGYALALMRAARFADARREVDTLLRQHPTTTELIIVSARLYREAGQPRKGLDEVRDALTLFPANYPLNLTLAEMLLADNQPAEAYRALQSQLQLRPTDARLYALFARAAGASGRTTEGHEYMAEHYYLVGDLQAAVLQLEIALKDKQLTFYDSSRLESRLLQMRDELEEVERRKKERG